MPRNRLPPGLLIGLVLLAGCLGGGTGSPAETTERSPTTPTVSTSPSPSTPATTTVTPFPDTVVPFPDGPKERPDRLADLTAETVREFVRTHVPLRLQPTLARRRDGGVREL